MTAQELKEQVSRIQWFHTIDLGQGVVTPGVERTPRKLRRIGLPKDLTGLSVLDIGAWDGFFSFEAERRGARRILAIDRWPESGWGNPAGFFLARQVLGSKVEYARMDLFEITPERLGRFDLVLFMGVLYHLRDPLGGLEHVFGVTGRQVILETHLDMLGCRRPAAAFYPGKELNNDPTNWWGPNAAAVKAMLEAVGFSRVQQVAKDSFARRLAYAAQQAALRRAAFFPALAQSRGTFHAFRD